MDWDEWSINFQKFSCLFNIYFFVSSHPGRLDEKYILYHSLIFTTMGWLTSHLHSLFTCIHLSSHFLVHSWLRLAGIYKYPNISPSSSLSFFFNKNSNNNNTWGLAIPFLQQQHLVPPGTPSLLLYSLRGWNSGSGIDSKGF